MLGRKVMTNLDSILESRDITLPTKVHLVKAMVFPVVMYGCESWTVKKVERWKIDAFGLWCWRRLLSIPWTARRSNQSILKDGCSLEGLMLKLKLQYFGHLMLRADSFEKTLMLGGIGGRRDGDYRGWDGQMASLTQWKWVWLVPVFFWHPIVFLLSFSYFLGPGSLFFLFSPGINHFSKKSQFHLLVYI